MVLKYEEFFQVNPKNREYDEAFEKDFFNLIYSTKYSANKEQLMNEGINEYEISLKEDNAKYITNQKTLKALITFLLSISEYELALSFIKMVNENFEGQFVNLQLARIYYEKGDIKKAENHIPKKLNNFDKCTIAGKIHEECENIEEAMKCYEKSLRYKVVPEVYHKIGMLSFKINQKNKALQNLLLAHKLNYKNKDIVKTVGIYYYNNEDYKNALKYFSMLKKDPQIEKYLGICHLAVGECDKAKKVFKKILKDRDDQEVTLYINEKAKECKEVEMKVLFPTSLFISHF